MDIILLPVLNRATSPSAALKILKESRRSMAVVVDSPPKGMIDVLEIRKAKNQNKPNLEEAELEPIAIIRDAEFDRNAFAAMRLPDSAFAAVREQLIQTYPGMAHRQMRVNPDEETLFARLLPAGMTHGFLGYDRGAAVVLTLNESIAATAGAPPADCACENPTLPHEYSAGQKKSGDPCDVCSFKVSC